MELLSQGDIGLLSFGLLPVPVVIVDSHGRAIAMNPRAEQVWNVRLEEIVEVPLHDALKMGLFAGTNDETSWTRIHAAVGRPGGALVFTIGQKGVAAMFRLYGADIQHEGQSFTYLMAARPMLEDRAVTDVLPGWAKLDPVTGLENRASWSRRNPFEEMAADDLPAAQATTMTVCMIDVRGLKDVNDTCGHAVGDRLLAAVGAAIRGVLRDGDAAVRYGGDEFLCVLRGSNVKEARAWADTVDHALAAVGLSDCFFERGEEPRLSWGFAAATTIGLDAAIRAADEDLYSRRGTLLKAASGARLLTRSRRSTVVYPASAAHEQGEPSATQLGRGIGDRFGREFAPAFQRMYRESLEQARSFVDWVAPQTGIAAVEVGAGTGRITLDGGLAARIGPTGQLLVTDPSDAQLDQLRVRSTAFPWLRFAEVSADRLPLASHCADLVIGAYFLHLCQPPKPTVRELARVLRPGGQLALAAVLSYQLPPFWLDVFAPVRAALAESGISANRALDLDPGDLGRLCESVGLVVQASRGKSAGAMRAPDPESAWTLMDQGGHLALFMRALPPERAALLATEVRRRLVERFAGANDEERSIAFWVEEVVAERPC